jgi:hypothetical protein
MNRAHQVRHMRGPVYLILVGVLALLNQWHILRWGQSWPLFLIVWGLLALAERAAWTADVREQQATHGLDSMGQSGPPNPVSASYWPAESSSSGLPQPFIQTHPPAPEDSSREER